MGLRISQSQTKECLASDRLARLGFEDLRPSKNLFDQCPEVQCSYKLNLKIRKEQESIYAKVRLSVLLKLLVPLYLAFPDLST